VGQVVATIKTKFSGEDEAIKADDLLNEFKANLKKQKPAGLNCLSRLVCKEHWDYSIEIRFKSKDSLGKFFEKPQTKTLHDEFVQALGDINKSKPHTQNFVHNKWEFRA
jgi:hypothetical protein